MRTTEHLRTHRNHLLGLWAARRLGFDGGEAMEYADEVAAADTRAPDDEPLIGKIVADFRGEGLAIRPDDVRSELARLEPIARRQVDRPG